MKEKHNIIINEKSSVLSTLNLWNCSTGWNLAEFETIILSLPIDLPLTIANRNDEGDLLCHDKNNKPFTMSFVLFFHLSYSKIILQYEDEIWTYNIANKSNIIDSPKIIYKHRKKLS